MSNVFQNPFRNDLLLFVAIFGEKPPTIIQLEEPIKRFTKKIRNTWLLCSLCMCLPLVILINGLFFSPSGSVTAFFVFNQICSILAIYFVGWLYGAKYEWVRESFLRANSEPPIDITDPRIKEYYDAVLAQGRDYLTNYEHDRLRLAASLRFP